MTGWPAKKERFPFAPLTAALGPVFHRHHGGLGFLASKDPDHAWQQIQGNPTGLLAELTGMNRRTLMRWTKEGIPAEAADRLACALGFHVAEIWPEWFPDGCPTLGVELNGRSDAQTPSGLPTTRKRGDEMPDCRR